MKVTLLPELFEPPVQHTLLVALLHYPIEDRHRVDLDLDAPSVSSWLATQSPGVREEILISLDMSVRAEALEPSHTAVTVVRAGPSDLRARPPRVCLDDARRFLDSPFVILLEDEASDRAFLDRMLTGEGQRFLERRIQAGFVRVDHGGGITVMARRMTREALAPENQHRMWVLFDSDAMRPGSPSADSEALRAACRDVGHHQLRRRSIESYLTGGALHGWATRVRHRAERDRRLAIFRSFVAMADDQRHHFNMKAGFERDAVRDADVGDLYASVSLEDRKVLARGFGQDIAGLFADGSVTEDELRADAAAWQELRPVLIGLLARIR